MYGPGAYLCESSTKSDEYAKGDPGGYYDGIRALVLCRVVMGKFYYTTQRDENAGDKVAAGEFDSTVGDRSKSANTFREFVVYDNDSVYPEYVVLYSRAHGEEDETTLAKAAEVPFLMELPLYWSNCHLDPIRDPFDQEYRVRDSCQDIIHELANQTRASGSSVEIVDVTRMEDSKMWTNYQAFKRELKSRGNTKVEDVDHICSDVEAGNNQSVTKCTTMADLAQGVSMTETALGTLNAEDAISLEQLDRTVNEGLLWHGSTESAVTAIGKDGFIIARGDNAKHGKRFGEGAYLAEDLDKSLQYTTPDSNGIVYFLLCRVVLGEVYVTTQQRELDAHEAAVKAGKHSILACPDGGPREFIVLEERQVYPEFIVKLRP
jgi:hypothetical protein